jgi:RimJ/RimL family protein N-acetyltransferase
LSAPTALAAAIATPRLDLEPLRLAHAETCYASFADPSLYRYIDLPMPADASELRERFAGWRRGSGKPDEVWLNWIAFERGSGRAAGWFQATVRAADGKACIAYLVFGAFQRRGVASEAVRALAGRLFAATGVTLIVAQTDERNEASRRAALAAGFVADSQPFASTLRGEPSTDRVYRLVRPAAAGAPAG